MDNTESGTERKKQTQRSSVPYGVVNKMPNLPVDKAKPEHGRSRQNHAL